MDLGSSALSAAPIEAPGVRFDHADRIAPSFAVSGILHQSKGKQHDNYHVRTVLRRCLPACPGHNTAVTRLSSRPRACWLPVPSPPGGNERAIAETVTVFPRGPLIFFTNVPIPDDDAHKKPNMCTISNAFPAISAFLNSNFTGETGPTRPPGL